MGLIDGLHNVPERFKRCCSSLAPPPTNNNNNMRLKQEIFLSTVGLANSNLFKIFSLKKCVK